MSVVTAKRISQVSGPQPDTVQSSLTQLSARESRREDVGEATAHAARTRRRRNTAHAVTASESRHTGHGHTVISLHDPIAYCKCSTTLRTRWNQSVPPCETRRAHCVTRARLSPNAHRGLSGPPEWRVCWGLGTCGRCVWCHSSKFHYSKFHALDFSGLESHVLAGRGS